MDIINNIKNEINYGLDNLEINELIKCKEFIQSIKGNIFISGIGKCETLAHHFCNLLKSISYKSFFISIQNSSHGDIGCLDQNDICILFSKSGNTEEIINFIKILKIKKVKIITVTCNKNCKIHSESNIQITLPLQSELDHGIINIPNNSCLIMLAFINIISKMLENIHIDKYKLNHLGGNIGNDLKYIEDVMNKDFPKLIFKNNLKILDVVLEMTSKKIGFLILNDIKNNIIGIITDGDIRRMITKNKKIDIINKEDINIDFFKLTNKKIIFKDVIGTLLKYKFIPVLENNICIGLLCENLIKKKYF